LADGWQPSRANVAGQPVHFSHPHVRFHYSSVALVVRS
jgi:hypothetical protein